MQTRWKKRAQLTGKGSNQSFIAIPHFVLRSAQWAELPGSQVKMLMELAGQFNGSNNGDLSATFNALQARGWPSNDTAQRALKGLEAGQWVVKTRQGGRHIGCSLYGITWWAIDECNGRHSYPAERKPSHAWKNEIGRPIFGQRKADFRTARGLEIRNSDSRTVPERSVA